MARERQNTIIDGHRYEMTMFAATPSYKLFLKLFKMLGPSFGKVMDAVGNSGAIQDVDLSSKVVVDGIQALTENIKESDLDHVIEMLKKSTHIGINGSEKTVPLSGVFEAHFSGDIGSMFKWLYWGLKVQYANFLDAFGNLKLPSEGDESQAASNPTP